MSFKRYLRVGPKTLAITATVIVIVSAIVAPVYLTREFPDRKDVEAFYVKAGSTGLEDYGNHGKPMTPMLTMDGISLQDFCSAPKW